MLPYAAIPSRVICDPALTAHGFRVYCLLATYADKDGWCYPSQRTLAKQLGIARTTMNEHLAHLTALGHIQRGTKQLDNGNTVPAYRPLLDLNRKAARAALQAPRKTKRQVEGCRPDRQGVSASPTLGCRSDRHKEVNTLKKKGERASAPPPEWSALKALLTPHLSEVSPKSEE